MKNWLKKQFTEFTAWMGFTVCCCAFFAPDWVVFCLGVVLVSIDDEIAADWARKLAPWASKKLDDVTTDE